MIIVDAMRGIDEGLAEKLLRAATAAGVTYNGPTPAQISRERERLLREQAETEDAEFLLVMGAKDAKEKLDNGKTSNS